jgi:hypothetical protein
LRVKTTGKQAGVESAYRRPADSGEQAGKGREDQHDGKLDEAA